MGINLKEVEAKTKKNVCGMEYAKKKRKEQKEKMADDSFQKKSKAELKLGLISEDIFELKNTFSRIFPISELNLENDFIRSFLQIYHLSKVDIDIFLHRFFTIYREYGFMGLRTNVEILGDELLPDK